MNGGRAALWAGAFALAAAAHAGLVAAALLARAPEPEGAPPSEPIVVELAAPEAPASPGAREEAPGPPAPEAATGSLEPATATPEPPAPEAPEVPEAAPEEVAEAEPPEPQVDLPPEAPPPDVEAAVALPRPAEPPKPEERREAEAPRPLAPSQARPESAPVAGGGGRPSPARVATWKGELALALARARRYPPEAYARRQEGVATVRLAMSRTGQVLRATLVSSSGSPALDTESLALVRRAQPLPALPPGLPDPLEITVPVRFFIR